MSMHEVSVSDVKAMRDRGDDFVLLDVRRPDEFERSNLAGVLIPLHELPARVGELRPFRDKPIVIHCHHGVRSLQAAHWLMQQGFSNVKSMAGGIDEWSLRIDPSTPRY